MVDDVRKSDRRSNELNSSPLTDQQVSAIRVKKIKVIIVIAELNPYNVREQF